MLILTRPITLGGFGAIVVDVWRFWFSAIVESEVDLGRTELEGTAIEQQEGRKGAICQFFIDTGDKEPFCSIWTQH